MKLRDPILQAIRLYQRTISPDHGWLKRWYPRGYCRFYPSCSEYGYKAIAQNGLLIGIPKMLWRIARCNPWNRGGIDLP